METILTRLVLIALLVAAALSFPSTAAAASSAVVFGDVREPFGGPVHDSFRVESGEVAGANINGSAEDPGGSACSDASAVFSTTTSGNSESVSASGQGSAKVGENSCEGSGETSALESSGTSAFQKTFTVTTPMAYSAGGGVTANSPVGHCCASARATLSGPGGNVFNVSAESGHTGGSSASLNESGTLQPGNYTLSVSGGAGYGRDGEAEGSGAYNIVFTLGTDESVVITSGPSGTVDSRDARFEFRTQNSNPPPGRFECSLDGSAFAPCSSPHDLTGLAEGEHVFQVRYKPDGGDPGPTAERRWTVTEGCPDVQVGNAVAKGCFTEVEPGSPNLETTQRAWIGGFQIEPRPGGKLVINPAEPAVSEEGAGVDMVFAGFKVPIPVSLLPVGSSGGEFEIGGAGTLENLLLLDLPVEAKVKVEWGDGGTSASYEQEVKLEKLTDLIGDVVNESQGEALGESGGKLKAKLENGTGFVLQEAEVKIDEVSFVPFRMDVPKAVKLKNILLRFELKDGKPFWTGQAGITLPLTRGDLTVTGRVFVFNGDLAGGGLEVDGLNKPIPSSPLVLQKLGLDLLFAPKFGYSGLVGADLGPQLGGKPLMTIDGTLAGGELATADCTAGNDPTKLEFVGKLTAFGLVDSFFVDEAQVTARSCLYTGTNPGLEMTGKAEIAFLGGALGYEGTQTGYIAPRGASLEGDVLLKLPGPDISGRAIISTVGVAACGVISSTLDIQGGFGHRWGEPEPPQAFEGCDLGPYRAAPQPPSARARATGRAQTAAATTLRLPAGLPHGAFAATAADGPPRVKVTGPGGFSAESPADGSTLRAQNALIVPVAHERTTYAFVDDPRGGTWKVESLDPAQPLTRVRMANGLEDPKVTGKVRRKGKRLQLDYALRPIPGQQVTFVERGEGVAKVIGRARGRGGKIRFTPTLAAKRKRTIQAEVTQNGLPREVLTVARFKAPPLPKLSKPKLKAKRTKKALALEWKRVAGAKRYMVEVAAGKEVLRRLLTSKRKVRFTNLPATGKLKVTVQAMNDTLPPGRAATLTVKAPRK